MRLNAVEPGNATRLNLSYILHEASTSTTVADTARRLGRALPRLERTVHALAALDDDALRRRVVLHPASAATRPESDAPALLTLRLGAWPLLQRALRLHGYPVVAPVLLDDPAPPEGIAVELFGEPARLALPAVRSAWFATLVARPGGRDLLLEVTEIEGGRDGVVAPGLVASIERALREHVLQWRADRPLWPAPAEHLLPELQSSAEQGDLYSASWHADHPADARSSPETTS